MQQILEITSNVDSGKSLWVQILETLGDRVELYISFVQKFLRTLRALSMSFNYIQFHPLNPISSNFLLHPIFNFIHCFQFHPQIPFSSSFQYHLISRNFHSQSTFGSLPVQSFQNNSSIILAIFQNFPKIFSYIFRIFPESLENSPVSQNFLKSFSKCHQMFTCILHLQNFLTISGFH